MLIRPDVIWQKISRPLYHVHFTVIHTNSRHKDNDGSVSHMGQATTQTSYDPTHCGTYQSAGLNVLKVEKKNVS